LFSKRLSEVSGKTVEIAEALRTAARLRVESGEAPALELIRAQVELARENKERRRAEGRAANSKAALNSLLGGSLRPEDDIAGDFSGARKNFDLPPLIERATDRHPRILRQKKVLEAAGHALTQERQSRIPDLTLRGGVGEEVDKRSYSIGLSLTFPLFNQRRGEIASARAGEAKAFAEMEKTRVELTRLITQEYRNYQIALDQLNLFEKGLLADSDEALQIARISYQEGESNLLELLDAQRVQRAVLIEYYEAQFELDTALARLERATGEML